MKTTRGCVNKECSDCLNRVHYKKDDVYCTKCGEKLHYVCDDCWTQLEDNNEKYCILCKNKRQDKKDEQKEKIKKVGVVAVGVIGSIGAVAKKAVKDIDAVEDAVKKAADVGKKVVQVLPKK